MDLESPVVLNWYLNTDNFCLYPSSVPRPGLCNYAQITCCVSAGKCLKSYSWCTQVYQCHGSFILLQNFPWINIPALQALQAVWAHNLSMILYIPGVFSLLSCITPGVSGEGFLVPGNGKGNWKSRSEPIFICSTKSRGKRLQNEVWTLVWSKFSFLSQNHFPL